MKRLRSMPDMPAVAESFPGFWNDGWYGMVAPKGTPRPIVSKLHAEMNRALADAEFVRQIEALGMVPATSTPDELREWIRNELARWTKIVRDAGIQSHGN
jgi:tripartite-type tricarboxylate transporter receptor subunit TctC